ncbi:PRP5 [[Candida] subhashii]|uniref:RNA helicase n=1 Tax=[Candida] subhashii TaxID=561895 RepID=A0A8J5QMF3_9ASCO|nr:PRP5 [[Candida] subhashii]KAG7665727.1 PRP5 [[Candida] subhashii]
MTGRRNLMTTHVSISGSHHSVKNGNNTNQTKNKDNDDQLSKEEKLRKRREQLALWREKKQQQQERQQEESKEEKVEEKAEVTEIPSKVPTVVKEEPDEKKRLRQQRIEEWKRTRAQKSNDIPKEIQGKSGGSSKADVKKTTILISKKKLVVNKPKGIKRKISLDEDEDDVDNSHKPLFKKPSLDHHGSQDVDRKDETSEDELDAYLASIDSSLPARPNSEASTVQSVIMEDAQDEIGNEEEMDDDEKQQELLSSKLSKFQQQKGKELKPIDYSQEAYEPVRKKFYQEPYELSILTAQEVDNMRQELGILKFKSPGSDSTFTPISKWSHLGLPANLSSVITDKLQFSHPSAIQAQALPVIMSGRDVIGVAKTGSGKTLAYVLPMLRHIQDKRPIREGEGPLALILCPTRELALQIVKEINHFASATKFRVCCCYGGSSIETQISELKKGVEIMVGTPGRVIDLLAANGGRVTNLKRTTYVVLDEADRMFDMGFEPQVAKIYTQIRPDCQTVLFSATFPRKMEQLARKLVKHEDAVEIVVGGISVVAPEIKQEIILFEPESEEEYKSQRMDKLYEILNSYMVSHPNSKILIFVQKQNDADELVSTLLGAQYPCVAIHGGKDQIDRKFAIKEFSDTSSGMDILIATSIAARGLDVKSLGLVINFDPPNHMEDYVHRVGRTGRAGSMGRAITFVSKDQEHEIANLVKALTLSKQEGVDSRLEEVADKFFGKVKQGKEKVYLGFGGKGLDKMKEVRESKIRLEKSMYQEEHEKESGEPLAGQEQRSNSATPSSVPSILPAFEIIEGNSPDTSGPDKCKYYSRVVINDLPQKARLNILNRENLSKIIDTTRTSITTKGQFYAPGSKLPQDINENIAHAKLYLLVEGLSELAVREANNLIRDRMIEGLEMASQQENLAPSGKYTV